MLAAPDIRVIGEAGTGTDALRLVGKLKPRVVLMGCYPASPDQCHELLGRIKATSPNTSVILLTTSERSFDLSRAIRQGCSGYLNPHMTRTELLKAVRAIARGECIIEPELLKRLLEETAQPSRKKAAPQNQLTPLELDVLSLITEGRTNPEIATALGYSVASIKDHVQRVIQKLGVSDRTQAAVKGIKTGLVT
jgi:DNA-binding NarL/FixJ family response regulator